MPNNPVDMYVDGVQKKFWDDMTQEERNWILTGGWLGATAGIVAKRYVLVDGTRGEYTDSGLREMTPEESLKTYGSEATQETNPIWWLPVVAVVIVVIVWLWKRRKN